MFGKFILRTFVGAMVMLLLLSHISMQEGTRTQIALIIVCTCGLALIVLIPFAYLVGLFCTIWFIPFGRGTQTFPERQEPEIEKVDKEVKNPARVPYTAESDFMREAIVNYISKALEKGMDWTSIHSQLTRNGWADSEIQAAYEAAKSRNSDV